MKKSLAIMTIAAIAAGACAGPEVKKSEQPWSVDRFADIEVIRYEVPEFENLSLQQKMLVYYLTEAAQWGRDIIWDQNCKYNLQIRELCEGIYNNYRASDVFDQNDVEWKAFEEYMKRVWFANGIHHHYSNAKFQPGFSLDWFQNQVSFLPGVDQDIVTNPENEIIRAIFDPEFLPIKVNQADGVDVVATSAVNLYEGVTQKEVEAFYGAQKDAKDPHPVMYGLNSKLIKEDGKLVEKLWTVDGMYGETITHIVYWLEKAAEVAENDQQKAVIEKLISYYKTGDLKEFDEYSILWVNDLDSKVDFVNGFIESYNDPLGMKGSWESYVNFKDSVATARTEIISANAQWFEDRSPVDPRFRKPVVKGVTAKVITAAMIAGDGYPATAIGINLPNSNWIRAEHGSKSVSIDNFTAAYDAAAAGNGFSEEFMWSDAEVEQAKKYAHHVDNIHTDLHECLGHGSGQLLPGVDPDALKNYSSTLEEARADIFALYYMADPKLVELGVMPDAEAYKAGYYQQMMNGLMTQLVRILPGDNIEEAHMRDRALIAYWTLERAAQDAGINGCEPALCFAQKDGKTYVKINDYEKLRGFFGELLGELQRIKSEGDFEAGRELVENYAVKVDQTMHQEVLARYEKLNLAPYKGFVNPRYELVKDAAGEIIDVKVVYGEGYADQMLRYSREYSSL